MGSLILDAVVGIVARLTTMLILMLILTVTSLIAMGMGVIFLVTDRIWPPIDPPYVALSQNAELLRVEGNVVQLGRLVGISVLLMHGILSSLVYAREPALGTWERLRRVGMAVLMAPIGLAFSVAMANIVIAILGGISAPARRFIEDTQMFLGVIGTNIFVMFELTSVLMVANVVSYLDAFVAGLAAALYCVQFVLIALLTILHRLTMAFFSLTLHLAVLVGFASAPANGAKDEDIQRMAQIADRMIGLSPIGKILRWSLTVSVVLALAGGLLAASQRQATDAFYATARAAASTNYGLLRASGQRTAAALEGVYRQLGQDPPQVSCALAGGESPCAAMLARSFFTALITLLIALLSIRVIYHAAERASPEASAMAGRAYRAAQESAQRLLGRTPPLIQAAGGRMASTTLAAWRWVSGNGRKMS